MLVLSFSLVTAAPVAAGAGTTYTRAGSTVEVTSLAEPQPDPQTEEGFNAEPETLVLDAAAFDAQTNPVTIEGSVSALDLGAGWLNTAYVEIGLRPEATKTERNAGVYLIAFNLTGDPGMTRIHLQDFTGSGNANVIDIPGRDSAFYYRITLEPWGSIGGEATLEVWTSGYLPPAPPFGTVTLPYGYASTWDEAHVPTPEEFIEDFSSAHLFYSIIAECRGAANQIYSATVGDITITSTDLYSVEVEKDWYKTNDVVKVTVVNPLANDPFREDEVKVNAKSATDLGGITLTLPETGGADTGVFTGSFTLVEPPVPPVNPGEVVVNNGDLVTVDYLEATDTATVDDTPPVISNVFPVDGSTITVDRPVISAEIDDVGSGIDLPTGSMTIDDVVVGAGTSQTAISYQPSSAEALADGVHNITVGVDDVAGNPAEPVSWSFTVDTEKPMVTAITVVDLLFHEPPPFVEPTLIGFQVFFSKPMDTSVTPTVTFGLFPGPPFTHQVVTTEWLQGDMPWQGLFSLQSPWPPDQDGAQTVLIEGAKDSVGNVMDPHLSPDLFVIDLNAPAAPVNLVLEENAPPLPDMVVGQIGSVEPFAKVEVWSDAGLTNLIDSADADPDGNFPDILIGSNLYSQVWVTAADDVGNRSVATMLENDIDAPWVIHIYWSVGGQHPAWLLEGDVIHFIIEGESGCTATVDIGEIVTGITLIESPTEVYTEQYIVLADDDVANALVTYRLTDRAGNSSTFQHPLTISIDTVLPTADALTPAHGTFVDTATPEISAVLDDNLSGIDPESIVMVVGRADVSADAVYDDVTGVVSYTPTSDLAEGVHPVTLEFYDVAGNGPVTVSWSFTVDTIDPVITIHPVDTPTDVDTQFITGNWVEENLETMTLTVNRVPVAIDCRTDIWSTVPVDASLDQEGDNLVMATITDLAGNSASAEAIINLDTLAPEVTVISPNGGEILLSGNMYNITWTALDPNFITDPITIEYSVDSGTSWNEVATAEVNDGGYLWAVPILDSSDCLIRVTGADLLGHSGSDESDAVFTITTSAPDTIAPAVTVNSPNGGESWQGGSTQTITWTATDDKTPGVDLLVALFYSSDGGEIWDPVSWDPLSIDESNDGAYSWTVPEINSSQCLVMVETEDTSGNVGYDVSDRVFTITTPGEPITSIALEEGWNLISLMQIPDNPAIETVLFGIDVLSVWTYDTSTGDWSWYSPTTPGELEEMVDGKGYWIEMSDSAVLTIVGQELPDPPAALPAYSVVEGWNLIGFKSTTPGTAYDYLEGIDGKYTVIYRYDSLEFSYFTVGPEENLIPGSGYWISVTEPGTIYP